jgi:hypothetical protein
MITALLIIAGSGMVFASAIMLMCLAEAPEGYEDGDGYHFGPEPSIRDHALLASPVSEYCDDAQDAGLAETQTERHGARVAWSSLGLR